MHKHTLQVLLMAIALLSVQAEGAGADTLHSATASPAVHQVEHAVYTQAGEEPMFTKIVQNLFPTTLHQATQAGDVDKVRSLLAKGRNVNGLDKNGITPLFWAAFVEDLEVARILVEHGAEIDFRGPTGATPLFNALLKGNEKLALWLLERGANPLTMDTSGSTLLHLASLHGMEDIVAILLERGADVNALNAKGFSPLSVYLVMPLQTSPGTVSPSFIFRLLEAGASYDPVPMTEKPLMDICLEMSNSYALDRELSALIARTKNAKLRAYAQEMLEKSRKLPIRETADTWSELRRIAQSVEQKSVQSSVLGTLTRDLQYDFWESAPTAIPFYNSEKVVIGYLFNSKDDPAFVADADKAVAAFLKLDDVFRLSLSDKVGKYAQEYLGLTDFSGYEAKHDAWLGLRDMSINEEWLKAFETGKKPMEDVWRMVGKVREFTVQRNTADGLIYIAMGWNCVWDTEHGVQLSFREGTNLANIDIKGGDLAE